MKKTYIGFLRDHSGSMSTLRTGAKEDYNRSLGAIQEAARAQNLDNIVSVIRCGLGSGAIEGQQYASWETRFSAAQSVEPLRDYEAHGNTPLFDCMGALMDLMASAPDANDPDVAFLIIATTDGEENGSRTWTARAIADRIRKLQATDRWTITFRVPRGYSRQLINWGIPEGNVMEWDQTAAGMRKATEEVELSMGSYFSARAQGVTATRGFYQTNLGDVKVKEVKAALDEIKRSDYKIFEVKADTDITAFLTEKLGTFSRGQGYYQLTKTEKAVQDYKKILIMDRASNKMYGGKQARQLLGLPETGTHKIAPGDHAQYWVFIQSTSGNRVLKAGTKLVWKP